MSSTPEEFKCPITREVMIHPFTTKAGNTYEYDAISNWLQNKSTDPMTNCTLETKDLIPNNTLRSQIVSWSEQYAPHLQEKLANTPKPVLKEVEPETNLDRILAFKGSRARDKINDKFPTPQKFSAHGHTYEFSLSIMEGKKPRIQVRCDGGQFMFAPNKEMFVVPQGIIFYDPKEIEEIRGDTNAKLVCKYKNNCTNEQCKFSHKFVCAHGTCCRNKLNCKFLHPEPSSVVPIGKSYPMDRECKYKTSCTNKKCSFAHPKGRMSIPRETVQVFITHELNLTKKEQPIALPLDIPAVATKMQFQGEFVFFFVPYEGTWAKHHYKTVIVHRYDASKNCHKLLGEYSLDGHYCNCVVGSGRYLVFSFWPYEDEAMRAIWEGEKSMREMKKAQIALEMENEELKKEVKLLKSEISQKDSLIDRLCKNIKNLKRERQEQMEAAAKRRREYEERKKEQQRAWESRKAAAQAAKIKKKFKFSRETFTR